MSQEDRVPILILSDSPSCTSGLGRITRDLAMRLHSHCSDVFEVAVVGYGGPGSRRLPFREYHLHSIANWLPVELPAVWKDFAEEREGIFMGIWDLSRFWWINSPQAPAHMRQWLQSAKMKKWVYHALDADGPGGKLSTKLAETMKGFDRVLDYSAFSCGVTGNTEHLPHGIDTSVFRSYDRKESKRKFRELGFQSLKEDDFLVGIVATNQARKDWALGIQTCRILLDRGLDVKLWCHTDVLERFWSLPNLIADYGLAGRIVMTDANFTDDQMAQFYSACDVTLGIGLGEGFGYPIFESLACGVPCVHGDYGGAAEHMPPSMKVRPIAYRHEGLYCCERPVFNPEDWADVAEDNKGIVASLPWHIDWSSPTLWESWEQWFRRGL